MPMAPIVPLARRLGRGAIHRIIAAFVACAALAGPAAAADPDALWKIVHGRCVPDEQRHRNPAPCREVHLRAGIVRGYAVLKDIVGTTQFLVIPTARVTGIESPALLARGAPNYGAAAWAARRYVAARAQRPLPRDAISLAVNSANGRSQNQLHIHVDCVQPDVRDFLRQHAAALPSRWPAATVRFNGHDYQALRLKGGDLRGIDPFKVLARGLPAARAEMGEWTLVVVGLEPRGFALLASHVDPATGNRGAGEELQDHSCALARLLPRGK